ncbi:MAG TPA: aminoacyl-tRNA hydrolase [Dehalococcoidia bacterium]
MASTDYTPRHFRSPWSRSPGAVPDFVVVGLGNPGSSYAGNRHNVGQWAVNRLAKRHNVAMKATKTVSSGSARIGDAEVLLVKLRTWVNTSGDVLGPLLRRLNVPIENVVVLYDELDLPAGRIRVRPNGSDGGYRGLKSIISATGSRNFGRVRIGIGRPLLQGEPSWDPEVVAAYVLANPPRDEREVLEAAVERACDAVECVLTEGYDKAMNRFNTAS